MALSGGKRIVAHLDAVGVVPRALFRIFSAKYREVVQNLLLYRPNDPMRQCHMGSSIVDRLQRPRGFRTAVHGLFFAIG